jgi:hypothetical protein
MTHLTSIASACARAWVRVYTSGMPSDLCQARRAEIESDLWECQQEPRRAPDSGTSVAVDILRRTFTGIPDDIGWRLDTSRERRAGRSLRRTSMAISTERLRWMGLGAIVGGALMMGVRVVDLVLGHPGRVVSPSGNSLRFSGALGASMLSLLAVLALLATLGVLGLYVERRRHVDRRGSAGLVLLLAGSAIATVALALQASAVAFDVSASAAWMAINLLMIPAYALLIPIGFVLAGMRLSGPWRQLAILVGLYLLVQPWMAAVLRASLPSGAALFGSEMSSLMLGLGAAGIGGALWSSTREASWGEPQPRSG